MHTIAFVSRLQAVALLGFVGCASTPMHTSPGAPHGTLRVHVSHDQAPRHHFRDVITIDGQPATLGYGRGGDLSLHLSPGTHLVQLSSTHIDYALELVTREYPYGGPCLEPTCAVFASATRRMIELVPHDEFRCEKNVQIDVTAGATTSLEYSTGLSPKCEGG